MVEPAIELPDEIQLFPKPERKRLPEGEESLRCGSQERLEQPLELGQRLLVERDVRQLVAPDAGFPQAVADRIRGKPVIVLDTSEALFLCGSHDLAVAHDGRRRV